ncbi:MAG: glycosyltransferase [Actinobacteria bacterium]|nr:glycosyltransferase [Actinomycetota bacterium]
MDQAKGEYVCILDADLQNDPTDILLMLEKINSGFDVVIGWRKNRKDRILRSLLSKIANYLIHKTFRIPFHDLGCSLKMIRKEALKGLRLYGESHRILPLILYWRGANISEIVVSHRERTQGKSKYGYSRVIKLIIDIITIKFLNSYGTKPAYVFGTIGIFSNIIGVLLLIVVGYDKFIRAVYVHNNPLFLIASFLILAGVQFLLMGLIAELLVRTYYETQKKPVYEIKEINNF